MNDLTIEIHEMHSLAEYERVPISFEICSRADLKELRRGRIVEVPSERRFKNYDDHAEERPSALPYRYQVRSWRVFSAFADGIRLGGAILAVRTDGFDMLEDRYDLAVLIDIRVYPEMRGQGVGSALVTEACRWAKGQGCTELVVETQDTNVSACRFYQSLGFSLKSIEPKAYGPGSAEAKLIWTAEL